MTQDILQRIAAGDRAAMEECIDRHGPVVWSMARRFLTQLSDARDAVQDIFGAVRRSAYRYDSHLMSGQMFIALIARRRLIERQRRTEREPDAAIAAGDPVVSDQPEVNLVGPEAARAWEALASLQPDEQRVLELAVCDGLTTGEIVSQTGLSEATVKAYVRQGLERVRPPLGSRLRDTVSGGTT